MISNEIERVAHTHFHLRPVLLSALQMQKLKSEGRAIFGDFDNYAQAWQNEFGDRFFDMGTFIRLGSAIEGGLKQYYMTQKGYTSMLQLRSDTAAKKGVFQRLVPNAAGKVDVVDLFKTVGVDLSVLTQFPVIQEIMLHRHLYAHNSGLLDDEYIDKLARLTSQDLKSRSDLAAYPAEDIYWFEPLGRLPTFIESARAFFRECT